MMLEALLAYLHLAAILSWVVFLTSQTALLRPEWFNAAALARLLKVHRIAQAAGATVLATGLARMAFGAKGFEWYLGQPLLWAKLVLLVLMLASAAAAGRRFKGWANELVRNARLPEAAEVDRLRRSVFRTAHLMLLLPVPAVLLARGIGVL